MRQSQGRLGLIAPFALGLLTFGASEVMAQAPTIASSWSHEVELAQWVDDELTPYLAEVLVQHPRFKGQLLRFVSVHEERTSAPRDELTRSIIRRLDDTLHNTPGVRFWSIPVDAGGTGCRIQDTPDYEIGIEIVRTSREQYRVAVRALDIAERHWVSGFGRHWQGQLTDRERDMLANRLVVAAVPGTRPRPFSEEQVDLLAQSLAQDLRSDLCGRPGGVIKVHLSLDEDAPIIASRVLPLLRHNLSAVRNVVIVDDPASASLHLQTHIEAIDGDLHQVWISAESVADEASSFDIGAQAYLNFRRRDALVAQETEPLKNRTEQSSSASALVSLAVLTPAEARHCDSGNPWLYGEPVVRADGRVPANSCFALDIRARDDIKLFLLSHDSRQGLRRMFPSACRTFGRARSVLVRGERLQWPVPENASRRVLRAPPNAGTQQIYVLAATDHKTADMLEAQVAGWQDGCARAGRGPRDASDETQRLESLASLVRQLDGRAQLERLDIYFVSDAERLATAGTARTSQ